MKFFTHDSTFTTIINSILKRIFSLVLFALTKRGVSRFLLLTPSCLKKQVIFDRYYRRFISIYIRDYIDFCTVLQIYVSDDYGIEKFKRASEIKNFYSKIVQNGKSPLIIDCGGNIGLATKYFQYNYPEATILCIEPDIQNISQAKANNTNSKIKFFTGAIGSLEGTGDIIDPGLGNNAYRIESKEKGQIKIISINQLLNEYSQNLYIPFIVKIDIEGSEFDLFSKNTEWVDKFPLLIVELHDWMLPKTANSKNFIRTIAPLERDFLHHGENIFSISNKH